MVTREEIMGNWNQVKGRLKEHWGQLNDEELTQLRGRADELVGMIQQRTGETRSNIERFLSDVVAESQSLSGRVAGATEQYASEAADYLREGYDRFADASGDFSQRVAHTVRNRPGESMLVAFGLGLAAGAFFFINRRR